MQKDLDDSRIEKDERDRLEKEVKDLNESLITYKDAIDALSTKSKKDLETQVKKLQEQNDKVKDLQSKLSNKEITIKEYKRNL